MAAVTILRPDVDFLLTNKCSNQCKHCVFESGKRLANEMRTGEVIEALLRIRNIFGVQSLSLSGGEPLTRPDFLEIYRRACDLFNLTLISTGTGLSIDHTRELEECPPRQAIVSIYGMESAHDAFCQRVGAYQSTMDYLVFLRSLKSNALTSVGVNIVCHRGNAGLVEEIMALLAQNCLADEVKLLALSPVGRGRDLLDSCMSSSEWAAFSDNMAEVVARMHTAFTMGARIEKHVEDIGNPATDIPGCYVVRDPEGVFSSCVHIAPDGLVYPCTMLVGREEFRLGSIRGDAEFDLRRYYSNVRTVQAAIVARNCASCGVREGCLGGCFGYHLSVGRDYRCGDARTRFGCPDRYESLAP